MSYLNFGTHRIDNAILEKLEKWYEDGYILTRIDLERVRSLRINLTKFSLSSENRRILRKYNHQLVTKSIPFEDYSWEIHKMGKDFYDTKFGEGVFTANKIKEIFTSSTTFNSILTFSDDNKNTCDGYCVTYSSNENKIDRIVHYAYPFYKLDLINTSFGIYMMTKAVEYFKQLDFDYMYLGSVHEPASLYKLQFKGLEWWDESCEKWNTDINMLKERVKSGK